jgi:hypothetical protein
MQTYGLQRFLVAPLAALAIGTTLLLTPHSASADQRDFILRNASNSTITRVYIAPSASNNWGDDQLGDAVLRPGSSWTFHFAEGVGGGTCRWDLRVVTRAGTSTVQSNVNLCTTTTVTYQ